MNEPETVRALYKKLLNLYPRRFRERFGESMQQTFNDLYKERQTKSGWFGFVLWMFVETIIGIGREHVLLLTEGGAMKNMLTNPRLTAALSFILCLPAAIILLFNIIGISQDFWPLSINPEIVVPAAFLLVPAGLILRGAPLRLPTIIGFLTTLPFMLLELVNRWSFNRGFPIIILFVMLWFLSTAFIAILIPILHNLRAGNSILANPIPLLIRVVLLALIAWIWFGLVIDQMPCFLGVPNCD